MKARIFHPVLCAALASVSCVAPNGFKTENENMIQNPPVELESAEYLDSPGFRFIGKDVECNPPLIREVWKRKDEFMPVLDAMAEHSVITGNECGFMHFNNRRFGEPGERMRYIVGKFFKAGTPVPDGLDFWDVPAGAVAFVKCRGWSEDDLVRQSPGIVYSKIAADAYVVLPDNYFQAEVYEKIHSHEAHVESWLGYAVSCATK
ncbi:MAG: GyrI-like domain-containing protein [Kiritimatiellaeota bacterium]|nr:GyrI-like domain-containing protein [Kiritimatiellota bacterium]